MYPSAANAIVWETVGRAKEGTTHMLLPTSCYREAETIKNKHGQLLGNSIRNAPNCSFCLHCRLADVKIRLNQHGSSISIHNKHQH